MKNKKFILGTFVVALITTLSLSIYARVTGAKTALADPPILCALTNTYINSSSYGMIGTSSCKYCVPTGEPDYTVSYGSAVYIVTPRHMIENVFPVNGCQYSPNSTCQTMYKNPAFTDPSECTNLVRSATGTN
nr:hypothetical protein [Pedobacter panaciterrae]